MGTLGIMPGPEVQTPGRRRIPPLLLPTDPSHEDLVHSWTLSARDQVEVLRCRGEANRRRFAVQLCTLRAYGRFLPEAAPTPVAITNHLARQLDLPLVLFGDLPERLATETEQLQRIRAYLGWQPFDDAARTRLTHWLTQRATEDILPRDLVERAEQILRIWQNCPSGPFDTRRARRLGHRACPRRALYADCHPLHARAAAGAG